MGFHIKAIADIINSQASNKFKPECGHVASAHGYMKGRNPKSILLQSVSLKKIQNSKQK